MNLCKKVTGKKPGNKNFGKKVPEKKSSYSEKCMGTKDVYKHGNKGD